MTVLHLPVSYLPWTVGGKEVYVHQLCRELRAAGVDAAVALHQDPRFREPIGRHEHEGVPVHVLPPLEGAGTRSAVYTCTPAGIPGFEDLLAAYDPDIVHFHDFSTGAGLPHLDAARRSGARAVMTYHSPGQTCLQRSLLYGGRTPCDGEIRATRCSACRLMTVGVPRPLAYLLGAMGLDAVDPDASGAIPRALTTRSTTIAYRDAWRSMAERIDRMLVHARWAHRLMLRNGVAPERLKLVRTAGPARRRPELPRTFAGGGGAFRVAFVGRCVDIKGVHVLVDAVGRLPRAAPLEVTLVCPEWDSAYAAGLLERVREDRRFRISPPEDAADVLGTLEGMDACIVPSLWLETGPLIVLEAFAAGVPVIGSRLGGIEELVRDEVDGLLFTPGDPAELAAILERMAGDPGLRARLKSGIRPPRSLPDMAREIKDIYEAVVAAPARNGT